MSAPASSAGQHLLVVARRARRPPAAPPPRPSARSTRPAHDVAQLDVLQLGHLEALGVVVEVLVDLALVHQVREELLQVPLPRHEDEDRRRPLRRSLWSTMTLRSLISCTNSCPDFSAQPQQELVDHQHDAAEPLRLGVLRHPLEPLAPARIDARRRPRRAPCT